MFDGTTTHFNLNFIYISQFIEYYTRLTQERCSSIDNEDVKKIMKEKEDRRNSKLKKKEAALEKKNEGKKKHQNLKMKKVNPHNAYGNFLSNSRFKSFLGFMLLALCLTNGQNIYVYEKFLSPGVVCPFSRAIYMYMTIIFSI